MTNQRPQITSLYADSGYILPIHKEYLVLKMIESTISMSKESKLKQKKSRKQNITVQDNAIKTLRTLEDTQAFYFYENLDKPTGQCAKSLEEFLDKIESIKPESLIFHHERNDFKNWIANTLEDSKLAQKIDKISKEQKNLIKKKICVAVKERLKELEGISIQVLEPETKSLSHSSNVSK